MALRKGIVLLLAVTASAQQVSNFDIPSDVAEAHSCGFECQQIIAQGNVADLARYTPPFDYDFYATASNFTGSAPGDILKVKQHLRDDAPEGVTAYKIQYTSVGIDGQPVPVTGFVALPPPKTGCKRHNLVAFATGTVGFYRGCARSYLTDFWDANGWANALNAGYAVVATDYAGLGNNYTDHKYFTTTQANDVYWSVVAAKKAFPSLLSDEWTALGHSQGGLAIWQLSEHEMVQDPDSGYLGGVALAPPSKLHDAYVMGMDTLKNTTDPNAILAITASAALMTVFIRRAFPEYDAPLFTDIVKARAPLADIGEFCVFTISGLSLDLTWQQVFVDINRTDDAILKKFQDVHAPAQGAPASKPLLVIQGALDIGITPATTKASFDASCGFGNLLHRTLYEGLEHNLIIGQTSDEWLQFLADRFAGKDFGPVCTESVVAFDEL